MWRAGGGDKLACAAGSGTGTTPLAAFCVAAEANAPLGLGGAGGSSRGACGNVGVRWARCEGELSCGENTGAAGLVGDKMEMEGGAAAGSVAAEGGTAVAAEGTKPNSSVCQYVNLATFAQSKSHSALKPIEQQPYRRLQNRAALSAVRNAVDPRAPCPPRPPSPPAPQGDPTGCCA